MSPQHLSSFMPLLQQAAQQKEGAGEEEEEEEQVQQSVLPILGSLGSGVGQGQRRACPRGREAALLEELRKVAPLRACLAAAIAVLQHADGGGCALAQGRAPVLPPCRGCSGLGPLRDSPAEETPPSTPSSEQSTGSSPCNSPESSGSHGAAPDRPRTSDALPRVPLRRRKSQVNCHLPVFS